MQCELQAEKHKICLYDKDIREPLFGYLEESFGKVRMFEEKKIGKSRADVIMLTEDSLIGIEIKSDADTYDRLKRQVRDYNRYCDYNYVVVGKTHEKHIEEHVPKCWGILIVSVSEGDFVITEKRAVSENPKKKKELQITMMWRPELQRLLKQNRLPVYKQRSKKFVQEKLLEKVEWELLKEQMCQELFERDYTLWDEELELYKNT